MTVTQDKCPTCKAPVLVADGKALVYDREPIPMLVIVGSAELAGRKHATFGPCQEKGPLYRDGCEPYAYFGHAIHRCMAKP